MKIRTILISGAALAVAISFDSGPWSAAQAQRIDELVVTARQREERLVDVPGTVNVFTLDTIRHAGIQRAEGFINLTPGVTMVDAAEVGDTQINIRGINGSRDAESSFAFIIDGILYSNPSAFNREFSNLQQIEIFKGPQGAIYGRNAAAGAMIFTTTKPGNEFEARVKATVGNEDTYFAQAYVSGPVIEDELFFSLSGDWRTTDGFYENTFLDADDIVDDFENFNINGRMVWQPTPDLTVDVKARYGEVDAAAITFNSVFALPAFEAFGGFEDVNDHDFVFQPNIDPDNDQESIEISGKFDYDMDWATLTGWALYSDIEQDFLADGTSAAFGFFNTEANCIASVAALTGVVTLPGPTFFGGTPGASFLGAYTPSTCDGYQFQVRDQRDYSAEFRLTSPSDQRLRWQAGVYFLDIDRTVGVATLRDETFLGGSLIESLVNPLTEALVHDNFDSRIYAVFGQVLYDLTETIEVSAAVRYDREKREVHNLIDPTIVSSFIGTVFSIPVLNPGLDPDLNPDLVDGAIADQDKTFEEVQPKISVTWDVTPSITLFANWGIGFKSGGFNNQGSAATVDFFINDFIAGVDPLQIPVLIEDVFEKETSSAFEWGVKGNFFDGRLSVEGAGYYTQVDDMQFFEFFVGPFGLLRVVNNIDEVNIWGGELSINVNPTDWLSMYAAGNVTRSTIKEFDSRPDTLGNESPYTPDFTINAGAQVIHPIMNSTLNLVGRVDFQYVGETWMHAVQNQTRTNVFTLTGDFSRTQRDAYHTLDLRVGIEAENWSITGFARNITDEEYLQEVIPAPEFGGEFIHPSDKRAWGFEMTLTY